MAPVADRAAGVPIGGRIGKILVARIRRSDGAGRAHQVGLRAKKEVGVVQDIEKLRPKLHVDRLGHLGVLYDREVQVDETGVVERVANGIAEGAIGRVHETFRIIPLGYLPRHGVAAGDEIRTLAFGGASRLGLILAPKLVLDVKGQAGIAGDDRTDLPAVHQPIALERQPIKGIGGKHMVGVIAARTSIKIRVVGIIDGPLALFRAVGGRCVIRALGIRVGDIAHQAAGVLPAQADLQAVVSGVCSGRNRFHSLEIGIRVQAHKRVAHRAPRTLAVGAGPIGGVCCLPVSRLIGIGQRRIGIRPQEQVFAFGTVVAHRQNCPGPQFVLHGHVVLHHVRRLVYSIRESVVPCDLFVCRRRTVSSIYRLVGIARQIGEQTRGPEKKEQRCIRVIRRVVVGIGARGDGLVERAEAGADGSLVIPEHVPGDADARIEVHGIGIAIKGTLHSDEVVLGRRRRSQIVNREHRFIDRRRVAGPLVAQAEI